MLHAGLLPLLAMRGSAAGERISVSRGLPAAALPLEGGEPGIRGLAISPDGSTAYATFRSPDVVLVVDLRAGRLRSAIDLTPAGVMLLSNQAALSADGKLLFVANQGVENIAVIDTATERVRKVLPFCPGFGDPIKASPSGKVYIGLNDGRLVTVSCADLSYTTVDFGVTFSSIALSTQRANLLYAVSIQGFFHAINLDTGLEERRVVLPKDACRPGGGIERLLLSPSGDVAYLGWSASKNGGGFGNITPFDLKTFRAGASTPIEDGVRDFAVHLENGRIYAVGEWEGLIQGRVSGRMYIVEWDPNAQKVIRRMPISPSSVINSIRMDPANPRYVYSTEQGLVILRKVDIVTGTEVMRVRFFAGKRLPTCATTSGSLAYITCAQSPLIHKLDLNSGKLVGTLDLPGLSGSGQCEYFDGKLYLGWGGGLWVINAADGSLILSRQMPDGLVLTKMTIFRDKIAVAAFLPGRDPDRMLILDARTLDVLNSFRLELPLVGRVGCAVASPDGSKLYVQQGFGSEKTVLQVLDSATLRVRKRIEPPTTFEGGSGDFGDFDEQKRIAYLCGFASVYKVHMDSDEFLGMLNMYDVYREMGRPGGWPTGALRGIHLSPARDRLFITSWDGHSVFQYDLRSEKWIPRVVWMGLSPVAAVISPDRRYLYTANQKSDTITRLDTTAGEVLDVIPLGGPVSQLGIASLLHGASFRSVLVVPGCVMAFLEGGLPGEIGPPFLTSLRLDASGRVATELADTKVLFDGVPAPILYAYAAQVGFVVPYSVAGKRKVSVQLIYKGEESYPIEFNVADAYPGIFTMDSSGQGQAAMLNQDGTLNGPANPAAKGSVVVFYATGGGQTDPPGVDGEITKDVLSRPRLPVGVWIRGQEAEVLYAGTAPGIVSGVMQVNIKLPMNIPSGAVSVTMMARNWPPSQDGVTMAVR
ncbi:MAG: hypothetical protein Q8N47_08895 [Bryobacterales bacterium]|nr:hypothetical protein [Bryobacterales bacterium]